MPLVWTLRYRDDDGLHLSCHIPEPLVLSLLRIGLSIYVIFEECNVLGILSLTFSSAGAQTRDNESCRRGTVMLNEEAHAGRHLRPSVIRAGALQSRPVKTPPTPLLKKNWTTGLLGLGVLCFLAKNAFLVCVWGGGGVYVICKLYL
jgi:hypothetical protein